MKKIAPVLITTLLILTACSGSPENSPTAPPAPVSGAPTQTRDQLPTGGGRFGESAVGTIASINGDTLVLTTTQGLVTVNLSANTSVEQTLTAALADLQIGQFLAATGTADISGNIVANSISVRRQNQSNGFVPPGGVNPDGRFGGSGTFPRGNGAFNSENRTAGTLSATNGSTLTVTDFQGKSVAVIVAPSTTIQLTVTGSISELRPGESVTVVGRPDTNGKINAFSILIRQ